MLAWGGLALLLSTDCCVVVDVVIIGAVIRGLAAKVSPGISQPINLGNVNLGDNGVRTTCRKRVLWIIHAEAPLKA